jgi:hypothetical protein
MHKRKSYRSRSSARSRTPFFQSLPILTAPARMAALAALTGLAVLAASAPALAVGPLPVDSAASPRAGDSAGMRASVAVGPAEPQHWALVPILMSTAETGVQIGALVMRFLDPADTANKPSSIGFAARISQRGQAQVNLFPEWYLRRNLYHVTGELNYIRWPAEFYGIGNDADIPKDSADAYTAQGLNGNLIGEREWFKDFSAGPMALFNYEAIEATGTRGLLTSAVPGNEGGLAAGLGAQATYDGRDAVYWARRGSFARAKAAWYRSGWGSDFDYEAYSLEARQFIPLFATGAIGLAATLQIKAGDVPFRELATADGDHTLRGIVRGKYRDRDLLVLQAEYKSYFPDWDWLSQKWIRNRLGWAAFAEGGQVAPALDQFASDGFRQGYGVGLRYAMNPAQRMNIRIDLGFVDGTVAPAINIKEAF